tara:strand:- start:87 stop:1241 length:1155 start_codon:yes stop_codon:yes gene_type:complete
MEATKKAALLRLNDFIESNLKNYSRDRNYDFGPENRENISMLSPYLRHRVITEELTIGKSLEKYQLQKIEKFIQEVLWRTYWKGWLEMRPEVWSDYKLFINEHKNHDITDVTLYKTNIHCFDSWTKELIENGYLHNHTRMWYASIWIHTLELPWQLGADFFMRHLLDGDPASNTLSWRWVAGLQTKGKSYLASYSNISKFTNNRFRQGDGRYLSSIAKDFEFKEYKANSKKFTEYSDTQPDEIVGLIVTSEDLDLETCQKLSIPNFVYILPYSQEESMIYSDKVKNFKQSLCDDVCTRLFSNEQSLTTDKSCSIIKWAKENKLEKIVTLATPTGYINDYLLGIKKELRENGIEFIKVFRDYDMKYWNYASKGFFNFFQKAVKNI